MMKTLILISFLISLETLAAKAIENPFGRWNLTPLQAEVPRLIGRENSGCMVGAVPLDKDAECYLIANPQRQRFYSAPVTKKLLEDIGQYSCQNFKKMLVVGDLSQARGGPIPTDHQTHQKGTSIDLGLRMYELGQNRGELRDKLRATTGSGMVDIAEFKIQKLETAPHLGSHSGEVTYQPQIKFSIPKEEFFEIAQMVRFVAQDDRVHHVIIHAGLKKKLCEWAGHGSVSSDELQWLGKIRLAPMGHLDHIHITLHSNNEKPLAAYGDADGLGCATEDSRMGYWMAQATWNPRSAFLAAHRILAAGEAQTKECKENGDAPACFKKNQTVPVARKADRPQVTPQYVLDSRAMSEILNPKLSESEQKEKEGAEKPVCLTVTGEKRVYGSGESYKRTREQCVPKECWYLVDQESDGSAIDELKIKKGQ